MGSFSFHDVKSDWLSICLGNASGYHANTIIIRPMGNSYIAPSSQGKFNTLEILQAPSAPYIKQSEKPATARKHPQVLVLVETLLNLIEFKSAMELDGIHGREQCVRNTSILAVKI